MKNIILLILLLIEYQVSAQFGNQQTITTMANEASFVFSADIDKDGDQDVLSASYGDNKIAWYENIDGNGTFGSQQIINNSAVWAICVRASDIDSDGDADVLSASVFDDKLAWYENTDGNGTFGPQQLITTSVWGPLSVFTADIDGDGDQDVLSASIYDNKIAWYENTNGNGNFGAQQIISTSGYMPACVYAADLDGDGDNDVISTSVWYNKIEWYENTDGNGSFGPQQLISTSSIGPLQVYVEDIDNDGDQDVLAASSEDNKIAWYENTDGNGTFSAEQIITTSAEGATSVFAIDLDGDGDPDVISASLYDNKIAWYENTNGLGSFGPQKIISITAEGATSVTAADIDNDGDADVLSSSGFDNEIAWYENLGTNAVIAYQPNDLEQCDDNYDGFTLFDLTLTISEILGNQDPAENMVTFHLTQENAENNINAIVDPENYINISNPQTIFSRLENINNNNYGITLFDLIVISIPITNEITDYVVPDEDGDGFAIFDLTSKIPEIVGTQTDIIVSLYETESNAREGNNPISNPYEYVNITNPQSIYARLEHFITGCFAVNSFIIFAEPIMGISQDFYRAVIVYPNPIKDLFRIENLNNTTITSIKIYDILGRIVMNVGKGYDQIDISHLNSGVLFLKIGTEEGVITKIIIKE